MPRSVFDKMQSALEGLPLLKHRIDAVGRRGIHQPQSIVAACRLLASFASAPGRNARKTERSL